MQVVWVVAPEGRARSGEGKVAIVVPGLGKGVVVWRERWLGLEGEWWIWRCGGRVGGILVVVGWSVGREAPGWFEGGQSRLLFLFGRLRRERVAVSSYIMWRSGRTWRRNRKVGLRWLSVDLRNVA